MFGTPTNARDRSSRTLVLVAIVMFCGLLVFAAAVGGQAGAASARSTSGCGSKVVFLVWPKGHPAMPKIVEFPNVPYPHVELYRGFNSGYDVAYAGAYIIGGKPPAVLGRGDVFSACLNYGDTVTKGTVAGGRLISRQTAVKCALHGAPVADIVKRAGGVVDLYVSSGGKLLAQAHVTKTTAALTVPSTSCTLIAPPHP